ncbi:Hypothetical protein A7982_11526 [Minicystis rosea]|nr:Hypothetical protein A7982_11526 [Minicystis rosea]
MAHRVTDARCSLIDGAFAAPKGRGSGRDCGCPWPSALPRRAGDARGEKR